MVVSFVLPVLQVNDVAPIPVKVVLFPLQIVVLPNTVIAGKVLTVIPMVALFLQPFASVPVTVYVREESGVNATALVTPPLHEYVLAPLPLRVTELPLHTFCDGEAEPVTEGSGLTVTVVVAVLLQPVFVLTTVTEYVVFVIG